MRWIALLLGMLSTIGLVAALPYLLDGSKTPAARWLLPVMQVQDTIAAETSGDENGRLIFVAGSSGLFGVDGETLSALTGREVINLSTHAGFSIDFHLDRAERIAKPGDLVVAAFELEAFYRISATTFEQEQALLWRTANYHSDPFDAFLLGWRTNTERLYSLTSERLTRGTREETFSSRQNVMSIWMSARDSMAPKPQEYYSFLHLDSSGSIYIPSAPEKQAASSRDDPRRRVTIRPHRLNEDYIDRVAKASARLKKRGITFVLIPPPLMQYAPGQFNDIKGSRAEVERLYSLLNSKDVSTPCSLDSALLAPERFLDTQYHLNAWGSTQRTIRIAECLQSEDSSITGPEDLNKTWLEVLQWKSRRSELSIWEDQLLDLLELASALEAYHHDHGEYPRSDGWDGQRTKWGTNTEDWVSGLAPDHIDALPESPGELSYLYRSDGEHYKLLYHTPGPGTLAIREIIPEFADPARGAMQVVSDPSAASW